MHLLLRLLLHLQVHLLDARGVISVTERQAYIGRVRALAKACAEAWLADTALGKKQDD